MNGTARPHIAALILAFAFGGAITVPTTSLPAQPAPRVTTKLAPVELAELEAIRRAVWVDWFSGDTAALRRVLAPELVAMSSAPGHWQSLTETIAASAKFKREGGKFVSVQFTETETHRFGETVVMFSHYEIVTEKGGTRSTEKGRVTEVFVRAAGRWVHTSWQLDSQE
jgi:ketosteroid isomerase-like protein